ncbi:hypothetical protein B7P43_G01411 [Cryptotermes secundus]|uniref:Pseudouridine synthase RsuA/RluA-like domain-containing protein n=1 Tax=Cryptotermes secundus TaxID=105785 RepID=A0A2J7R221_9NEOP|nr:mitochondrial mRNA pseudouridine synthase RPUSD3 [Cryptotermes secundus]PNF34885.1 hypothetical protein B7P43_G01411 [Cryptotermes secundus]
MTLARLRITSRNVGVLNCRCCSRYRTENRGQCHEYQKHNVWRSLKHFSDFLTSNVIYNKDGLLVLNKPYGIGLSPSPTPSAQHSRHTDKMIVGQSQYYLTEALPHIAGNLGYNSLTVLKIPERYTSGVTVLSSCNKVMDKVRTCMKKASGRLQSCAYYWAVVIGNPQTDSAIQKLGLTFKENPTIDNDKQPIVVRDWSKNAMKRGDVKVFKVHHHTLCKNNLASLVEICPSATKWHFLRVYLAHLMSPVLGDNLYGSRVHQVMGVHLAINPTSDAARGPKKLPKELQAALAIKPGQEVIIPTHLHLRRLILPHYLGKDSDLIIEAPLPSSFQWTCQALGLNPDYDAENVRCTINCDR